MLKKFYLLPLMVLFFVYVTPTTNQLPSVVEPPPASDKKTTKNKKKEKQPYNTRVIAAPVCGTMTVAFLFGLYYFKLREKLTTPKKESTPTKDSPLDKEAFKLFEQRKTVSIKTFYDFKGAAPKFGYAEKILLSHKARIHFIGDLHGCFSVFQRILNELKRQKVLDNNDIVVQNNYIVFLGDYYTRGKFENLVFNRVLDLMNKNKDNVFALRGNMDQNEKVAKFPSALFLIDDYSEEGCHEKKQCTLACFHGGCHTIPDRLQKFIYNEDHFYKYETLTQDEFNMFTCDNYTSQEDNKTVFRDKKSNKNTIPPNVVSELVKKVNGNSGNNSTIFFRGHQHSLYGCKLINTDPTHTTWDGYKELKDFKANTSITQLPTDDSSDYNMFSLATTEKTLPFPVITLSAAAGGATDGCDINLPKECFASYTFNTSLITIYEKK